MLCCGNDRVHCCCRCMRTSSAQVAAPVGSTPTPAQWQRPTPEEGSLAATATAVVPAARMPTPALMPHSLHLELRSPHLQRQRRPPGCGRPLFVTAIPEPPIECRSLAALSACPPRPQVGSAAPSLAESGANWMMLAAGEPMPDVSLELRMPSVAVIAGTSLPVTTPRHRLLPALIDPPLAQRGP